MTVPTGSDSRDRIRAVLLAAGTPMSVEDIAETMGLHANTVRGHLDVLLASGVVSREPAEAAGRGRPKWLYRAGSASASPFQLLAEVLTAQLSRTDASSLAEQAAERWAHALPALPEASNPDDAVAEAAEAMTRLGFSAEVCGGGEAIDLHSCPYSDLVAENPVICDIHAALVARLLEQTGQPVALLAMDVWTRPNLCRARLHRPDLKPTWTIHVNPQGQVIPAEGTAS